MRRRVNDSNEIAGTYHGDRERPLGSLHPCLTLQDITVSKSIQFHVLLTDLQIVVDLHGI